MPADYQALAKAQKEMHAAIVACDTLAVRVGYARAVVEMHSESCKIALAEAMKPLLEAGESAAKAEALARASDGYKENLRQRFKDLEAAQAVLAQWTVAQMRVEVFRTDVSAEKALANL